MRLSFRFKTSLFLLLLVIFFVVLNLTDFSNEIKNFFYRISEPLQKTFWRAGAELSNFLAAPLELKILKEENEAIYLKNQELVAENLLLKELKKENEDLREALNLGLQKEFQLIFAQVIGQDVSQDSILINKGEQEGVLKGSPVITGQKVLLGKIGQVYDDFSEVILISNQESSFDVKISEKDVFGVLKGKGNLQVYLDFVPKNKEIALGDLIVSSRLGGICPAGLLVGEIEKVTKLDVETWQTAEIKPSFDLSKTENLFIISSF